MKKMQNQQGYIIQIVLIVFAVIIGMMIFPVKFPVLMEEPDNAPAEEYCRDLVDDPDAPVIEGPTYTGDQILLENKRKYRLIKEKVPIYRAFYLDESHEHFFNSYKESYTDSSGQEFIIRIPKGEQGQSYKVTSELGDNFLQFADYGLIYLFYSDDGAQPTIIDHVNLGPGATSGRNGILDIAQVDIYKAVDLPPLPEWVLKCNDMGLAPEAVTVPQGKGVVFPEQKRSQTKDQLQLEWFLFNKGDFQLRAWWVPHCKPAVYLYPKEKQLVNVKVFPKGELGFTDPPYDPSKGWTVNAFPDGKLLTINDERITNNYLYYESKILDSEIKKPTQGWVVKFDDLGNLYNEVLPKLGLNKKEQKDFSDYWLKTLPKSPYYFVGLIEKSQRDYLETLGVTPKPDTSIRFSLYFEALDQPKAVIEPEIKTPIRNGFTLVDWGGMVKLHPGTPFTCSQ